VANKTAKLILSADHVLLLSSVMGRRQSTTTDSLLLIMIDYFWNWAWQRISIGWDGVVGGVY